MVYHVAQNLSVSSEGCIMLFLESISATNAALVYEIGEESRGIFNK